MEVSEVTIGIPVVELARSRDWYERMLGKPPELEPVAGLAEFRLAGTWLQLMERSAARPGWSSGSGSSTSTRSTNGSELLGSSRRKSRPYPA